MHFLNRSRLWLAAFGVNGITLARSLAARDDTTFDWFNVRSIGLFTSLTVHI